jgi:hypothetical protein
VVVAQCFKKRSAAQVFDEGMYALIEDLIYSQQVSKLGWVKGVG